VTTVCSKEEVKQAVQSMARFTALLYYHLTKEILSADPERGREIIRRAIRSFGLDRGKRIAERVKRQGLPLTIENLHRFYDMPIVSGWEPKGECRSDGYYSRTEACTFADVWQQLGYAEIGRLYCEVDPAIREGYNPDIEYLSTSNILDGDPYCSSVSRYRSGASRSEGERHHG
jgi:hypothetical protein